MVLLNYLKMKQVHVYCEFWKSQNFQCQETECERLSYETEVRSGLWLLFNKSQWSNLDAFGFFYLLCLMPPFMGTCWSSCQLILNHFFDAKFFTWIPNKMNNNYSDKNCMTLFAFGGIFQPKNPCHWTIPPNLHTLMPITKAARILVVIDKGSRRLLRSLLCSNSSIYLTNIYKLNSCLTCVQLV